MVFFQDSKIVQAQPCALFKSSRVRTKGTLLYPTKLIVPRLNGLCWFFEAVRLTLFQRRYAGFSGHHLDLAECLLIAPHVRSFYVEAKIVCSILQSCASP